MWFVAGLLLARHQPFLSLGHHVDLKQFHSKHPLDEQEPLVSCPIALQYYHLCERLCLSLSDALTHRHPFPSPPLGGHVSSIDNNKEPSPGHGPDYSSIVTANVAALHHWPPQGGCPAGHGADLSHPGRPKAEFSLGLCFCEGCRGEKEGYSVWLDLRTKELSDNLVPLPPQVTSLRRDVKKKKAQEADTQPDIRDYFQGLPPAA